MTTHHIKLVKTLKGSETPLGKEMVKLKSEIAELDSLTEAEIRRHRDRMADLTKRSVAAKRQWNSQVPFTRLPVEVVTIIFQIASSEPDKPLTPLRIGSICHDWRTIAWSASELWSSVTVCLEVQKEASKIQANLLSDWLLRAGKRPLSVTVTTRDKDEEWWNAPQADDSAFSSVLSYSDQWRSADLTFPRAWQHLLGVRGNFSILEHLTLKCKLGAAADAFLDAPRLHSLNFADLDPTYLRFPWSQITNLAIEGRDTQEWLTAIEECSSLVCLVLTEYEDTSWDEFWPLTMINLDGLTSLFITSHAEDFLIMDSFSTPNLEDVDVNFVERDDDVFYSLRTLIFRSGCTETITRFSFCGYFPSEQAMMSFLLTLPNLSELELINRKASHAFSSMFIDALRSRESASSEALLLPNLLSVKYKGPITLDSHGFLDMLYARYNIGEAPKLKLVSIHSYDMTANEICDLSQIQLYRARGLIVDMKYLDTVI